MKAFTLFVLFVLVCLLTVLRGEVSSVTNTTYVASNTPLLVSEIGIRPIESTVCIQFWQARNPNRQIVSLEAIVTDDYLSGFNIVWKQTDNRVAVITGYLRCSTPFVSPANKSTIEVLREVWPSVMKVLAKTGREKATPFSVATTTVGEETIVFGVWYQCTDPDSKVRITSEGHVSYGPSGRRLADLRNDRKILADMSVPLPQNVIPRPGLVITHSRPLIAEGAVVMMKPFVVEEIRTWMSVSSVFKSNGEILYLKIRYVKDGCPYDKAGLKPGMIITDFKVSEPDDKELSIEVQSGWTKGDISFLVKNSPTSRERQVIIPADMIRRAFPGPKFAAIDN